MRKTLVAAAILALFAEPLTPAEPAGIAVESQALQVWPAFQKRPGDGGTVLKQLARAAVSPELDAAINYDDQEFSARTFDLRLLRLGE
jgi:hypothetical protein